MTQRFINSIISTKIENAKKEYYCEIRGKKKKTQWLKQNEITDFDTHLHLFEQTRSNSCDKPLEELDSIQNDKQNLTIISQLSNDQTITHSGLQWATIYHGHDFYYYSGQFMTYEEMKKEHPAELLDFYETKIIQKKLK